MFRLQYILKQSPLQTVKDFVRVVDNEFVSTHGQMEFSLSRAAKKFRQLRRQTKKEWLLNGIIQEIKTLLPSDDLPGIVMWHDVVKSVERAETIAILQKKLKYQCEPVTEQHPIIKNKNQQIDSDGFLMVYTDGACLRNGSPDAQAGIGIWYGRNHPR